MKVLLFTGLGALFFSYYWDDNFDPASLQGARVLLTGASAGVGEELAYHYARLGSHLVLTAHTEALLQKVVGNCRKLGAPKVFYIAADMASPEVPERVVQFALDKLGGLDYLVLNHLGATPAGSRSRSVQATRWLMQVNFLSYVQLTSLALPSLTDSKGSLVVVSSLLGQVPTSFSRPYSAAKFALDGFFGSLRRELDVQDVNVAITMCVLGLRDRASPAEGVRGVTRAKAAPGPKAALAVIRGGATRAPGVFYPWRFRLLCLLRGWLPHPRAWFIRQELNVTAACCCLSCCGWHPFSFPERGTLYPAVSEPDTNRDTSETVAVAQDRVIKTEKENREILPAPGNTVTTPGVQVLIMCQAPCQ